MPDALDLHYSKHLLECTKCNRKILVEEGLCGVSHTVWIHATCAECLGKIDPHFKRTMAEHAAEIEKWRGGSHD